MRNIYLKSFSPYFSIFVFSLAMFFGQANAQRTAAREHDALPVIITSLKAWQQQQMINVEWNVDNQVSIRSYEIQKSSDGIKFKSIHSQEASKTLVEKYNWPDRDVLKGTNFYRIRIIGLDYTERISQVVRVNSGNSSPGITIYPNPVKDGMVGVQLNDQPEGNYNYRLYGQGARIYFKQEVYHDGKNGSIRLNGGNLPPGIYQLHIIGPEGNKEIRRIIVN